MGNMGSALMEAQEHQQQMIDRDLEAGHKPGCLISTSPAYGGGFCNCGKFERGVSKYDPVHDEGITPIETEVLWGHPFWHICRKCASFGKIATVFLAADVASEFITFMPIHRFFEWMGWIA